MFNFRITENQDIDSVPERGLKIENVPLLLILGIIFLLPVFFLPSQVASLSMIKIFLAYILTIVSLFIWVLLRLKEQSFSIPVNLLSLSVVLVPIVYIISGLFSQNITVSFFARDFAIDSVLSIIILFVLLGISIVQFNNKTRIVYAYAVLILSFLVVAVLHLLNVLIPAFPSFGLFFNSVSSSIGKWNDLALFSALIASFSLMTLSLIRLVKGFRILMYVVLALSLLLMILVNFSVAWYILGAFSLLFFIYMIVNTNKQQRSAAIPFMPLFVFLLSFLFVVAGSNIGNYISPIFNINHFEVRPSWSSTISVVKSSLIDNPVFGAGPALFENQWLLHKPQSVLLTNFWNLDFRYGVGLIPSFFATTGIVGGLTWIFFFVMFILSGFKGIFRHSEDSLMKFLLLSTFSMSAMLWVIMVLYLPSSPLVVLTFVMTGMYISLLYQSNILRSKHVSIDSEPRFGFLYITVLVLVLIGSIASGYHTTSKFVAHTYFQKAAVNLGVQGDIDLAESNIRSALQLERNDIYLRSLGEIGTLRIATVLNDANTPQDLLVDRFRNYLAGTIESYRSAIEYDKLNYNNYVGLANLYRDLMALNVQGSYDQANSLYLQALDLKVDAPDIYLALARLEALNGNNDLAKEYIGQAVVRKPNYVEAAYLYSQIAVSEGNIAEAISAVESASIIQPNDYTVFFQLGLLQYNDGNYPRAVAAFERAVVLNPQFQNAKYFLGLSYDQVGNDDGAIAQFEDLANLNPDNAEVSLILSNLEEGRSPFVNAEPPIDESPESRDELPLNDGEIESVEGE